MSAYLIGIARIDDPERFAKYLEAVPPTVTAFGGEPLAIEDPAEVLESNAPFPRVVLLRFPSKEDAHAWKSSPEYQEIVEHRLASSEHVLYLVDEFVMPGQMSS